MDSSSLSGTALARRWQWLVIAAIAGWLIYLLAPVLTPFVCAALLGWLGDPWVDRLQRRGYSRTTAVVLVFTLMLLLLALALIILLPMLERQVVELVESLPNYRDWFVQKALPWVERRTGLELVSWLDPEHLMTWLRGHWQQAGGVAALVPRDHIGTVSRLAQESNDVLGAFLRGQFLVMLALGGIYAAGLTVVGLELGLLIGIIAGLISFVPYLGTATGIVLGVIAALVQTSGDWTLVAMVLGVFIVGQMLEGYVLTPRIVGDRIGLHPVAVIFAIMAGGQLFGFLGMLLALPIAAIANVLLRFAHERYTQSHLYAGDHPTILLDSHVEAEKTEHK